MTTIERRARRGRSLSPGWIGLGFVLPCFLLFLMFRFGPAIAGVLLSFANYTVGGNLEWKGLLNYQRLIADPGFLNALRVTLVYTLISVPLTIAAATGLALLTRRAFRGARLYRSIFFLPVVTSLILAGVVFTWIFSSGGPWSTVLSAFGFPVTDWLESGTFALPAVALVGVWTRFGYGVLIILARLQEVPRELEEAAVVDGAGPWRRFRHVVLPQLRPAVFFLVIIETTFSFQAFDTIYVMTSGGPVDATYSLVFDLYQESFVNFDFGYAGAIGVVLFVLTLVIALIQRATLGRES
ncbi:MULTISPECIES: carbohydrate ABC transporter permease [Actinoalloteichus]|uniref:Permease component of ABC-type sugar transporter n=1 Tax=Actinoalloteichus fjordicus TaxID=1612552 RepID=A0AAC9PT50_9PSEU|nr:MULTISPECIES: sugar ABC transporter permease [Actinoalloteichus]APU15773.1 permease component of ABC-type sugar transporter [Actinoalloteichus fjordicus]APU21833.1 permease component of ABC-type sugar transporter [Actinoalloteichus sp. GBA129-24]